VGCHRSNPPGHYSALSHIVERPDQPLNFRGIGTVGEAFARHFQPEQIKEQGMKREISFGASFVSSVPAQQRACGAGTDVGGLLFLDGPIEQ
jgi:hypothetical protein